MRKLTVAEAAAQWEEAVRAIEGLTGLRDQAAKVLDEYFERTGRRTYKDRIMRERTGGTVILDQPKVREYLGPQLSEFQTTTKRGWKLKLLR